MARKAFLEHLKIVLELLTERVNLSGHWHFLSKYFIKIGWLIFNVKQNFIPNSYLATVTLPNVCVD